MGCPDKQGKRFLHFLLAVPYWPWLGSWHITTMRITILPRRDEHRPLLRLLSENAAEETQIEKLREQLAYSKVPVNQYGGPHHQDYMASGIEIELP